MKYALLSNSNILGYLESMRAGMVASKLGAFSALASLLAAILCGVVMLKIAHDYMEGQGITLWTLVRPLVILVLVCNFNSLVATPVHGLCNIFTKSMSSKVEVTADEYCVTLGKGLKDSFDTGWRRTKNNFEQTARELDLANQTEDQTGWQRFWSKVKIVGGGVLSAYTNCVLSINDMANLFAAELIMALLLFVMKFVIFMQQITCYVYLILLMLLGPFSFALAILPAYQNNISSWLAKYIQTCFWIPVGQTVLFINYQMMNKFLSGYGDGYGFGSEWIAIVCALVCIINVLSVPKICNYVIDSTGVNGAHDRLARYGSGAATVAGKAVLKV